MPLRPPSRALRAQNIARTFTSDRPPPSYNTPRQYTPRNPPSSSSSSSKNLLSLGRRDDRSAFSRNNYNNNNNNNNNNNGAPTPGEAAARLLTSYRGAHQEKADSIAQSRLASLEMLKNVKNSNDYLRQMPRRWEAGDVYSPHDMSAVEMSKWRRRSPRKADVVDALGLRPLDMYKNFSLIREFTNSSGQIIHSQGTSLRPVNQRKIAKMIRRVQGMGLYPTIHDHPEMIRDDFYPSQQ